MILTCEKCHTRYILASQMLGYEGRKVRCTHCGHEWYQEKADDSDDEGAGQDDNISATENTDDSLADDMDMADIAAMTAGMASTDERDEAQDKDNPFKALLQKMHDEHDGEDADFNEEFAAGTALAEEEDASEDEEVFSLPDRDDEDDFPPAPEGVLPSEEDADREAVPDQDDRAEEKSKKPMDWSVAVGGILIIILLTLSAVLFIVFHQPIVRALPATASIYNALGLEVSVVGEGLVFDNVIAVSRPDETGKNKLYIEGELLNVASEAEIIPKLGASLLKEDGTEADLLVFRADKGKIAPNERVKFRTVYSQTVEDIAEVKVHFVLR